MRMSNWDQIYRDISRRNWIVLLLLSAASYFFMSNSITFGVISGGCIIIANFKFLQSTIRKTFDPEEPGKLNKAKLIVKSFFRLSILGVILFLLIKLNLVHPIGLTIGLSTVVISIVSFGITRVWESRMEEAF